LLDYLKLAAGATCTVMLNHKNNSSSLDDADFATMKFYFVANNLYTLLSKYKIFFNGGVITGRKGRGWKMARNTYPKANFS
jgi:hypothetical protein